LFISIFIQKLLNNLFYLIILGIVISQLDQAEKDLHYNLNDSMKETVNPISVQPSDDASGNIISVISTKNGTDSVNPGPLISVMIGKEGEIVGENEIQKEDENTENEGNAGELRRKGDDSSSNGDGNKDGTQGDGNKDGAQGDGNKNGTQGDGNKDGTQGDGNKNGTQGDGNKDGTQGDVITKNREKRYAFVYLIWSESMCFVKFGRSNAVGSRFRRRYKTVRKLNVI
jgi:hypothetical protein